MTKNQVLVVFCTCPPTFDVKKLAVELIEQKFAACVNVVPKITSIYPWKGQICEENEVLLVIKTTEKAYPKLQSRILARHPYEVPEILALPTTTGFAPYLQWVKTNIGF